MVCKKCEKKLTKLATPEVKKGDVSTPSSSKAGPVRSSKLLKQSKTMPYANKCTVCRSAVHQKDAKYCQGCAYKKGCCAMCGKEILDTSKYRMSAK